MQKLTSLAMVAGATIIAAALVYHGRQLATVATRLDTLEAQLPVIIEQAGRNAGQQVVQGMLDEAIRKPLGLLKPTVVRAKSNLLSRATGPSGVRGLLPNLAVPLVRFNIPEPVINIEIRTDLKALSDFSWPLSNSEKPPQTATNQTTQVQDKTAAADTEE